jgi:hypothetical protein
VSKRKYEVEIMVSQIKTYHVYAEDEADLLQKQDNIEDKGNLIKTEENTSLGNWRFLENVSK